MSSRSHRAARPSHEPSSILTPPASTLPLGEQFMLWALRQWRSEVALWDARQSLPAGGSALRHGFESAGVLSGLPHFAMVMDAVLSGAARPPEIHPVGAPLVAQDEATLLALFELAQDGLEGPLAACFSALLPPEKCAVATAQAKLLAGLLTEAGLGPAPHDRSAWLH